MTNIQDLIRDNIISSIPEDAEILEWVSQKYRPEDVFTEKELNQWAEENGFVKNEES